MAIFEKEEMECLRGMTEEELTAYLRKQYQEQRPPQTYGYIRVSTKGQAKDGTSLEDQMNKLQSAGAAVFYKDVMSGAKMDRPGLEGLLKEVRAGDTIICTKLDRFSRSATEGIEMITDLVNRGVIVKILNLGTIDNSQTGMLIMNILMVFAAYERDLITERLASGRAYRRTHDENYREGRPIKYTVEQREHAMELLKKNSYSKTSKITGIPVRTLCRYKARALQDQNDGAN